MSCHVVNPIPGGGGQGGVEEVILAAASANVPFRCEEIFFVLSETHSHHSENILSTPDYMYFLYQARAKFLTCLWCKKTPWLHHLVDVNLELLDDGLHDVIDVAELAGLAPLGAVENPGTVDSNVHRLLAKLQSAGYGFTAAQPT